MDTIDRPLYHLSHESPSLLAKCRQNFAISCCCCRLCVSLVYLAISLKDEPYLSSWYHPELCILLTMSSFNRFVYVIQVLCCK